MKRPISTYVQIGFWLCYFFILTTMVGILLGNSVSLQNFYIQYKLLFGFIILPSMFAFYTFYKFLFPKLTKQRVFFSIGIGLLFSVTSSILGRLTLFITHDIGLEVVCGMNAVTGVFFVSSISFACGVIALIIRGFSTWINELKLKEELQQKSHKMELALVKSQLDPHFIFNTINNIDTMILKDSTKASNYLNKLSDILRFMLLETKTEYIPLSKEIEYIEKFIDIQKIRTSNSEYVNFTISGNIQSKKIKPMSFIPFIENAFKYSSNKKVKNAIMINMVAEKNCINFYCTNKFDPKKPIKGSNGLGNSLIVKWLNLVYPDTHELRIEHLENTYSVNLKIKDD